MGIPAQVLRELVERLFGGQTNEVETCTILGRRHICGPPSGAQETDESIFEPLAFSNRLRERRPMPRPAIRLSHQLLSAAGPRGGF